MHDVLQPLLTLLIVLIGFGVIVGFPFGKMLKVVGKWGLILLVIGIVAPLIPTILDHLQKNPPQSLQELSVWLGFTFVLFVVFLRILFGTGAVGRLFERLVASAIYDVLKSLFKALFFGYLNFVKLILRLFG